MTKVQSDDVLQYLTFEENNEVFGIDIHCIKEVLGIREITNLPCSNAFMRGVINLRGQVVPVIDLKTKFGFEPTDFTVDTCIIILELERQGGKVTLLGALTDSVRDVIDLLQEDVSPPPEVGASVDSAFIYGIGKFNGEFFVILDAHKLCAHEELSDITITPGSVAVETQPLS
ncbi:MAG: chemotaxis protein CheW [Alteromonadaceae bacterium]|nr:MAG: chemotaxis protein CheW [Alteromonadaceae bacterium]